MTMTIRSAFVLAVALASLASVGVHAQQYFPIDLNGEFGDEDSDLGSVKSIGLHSHGRQIANAVQRALAANAPAPTGPVVLPAFDRGDQDEDSGRQNVLVNNPAFDNIQSFPALHTRPFEESTQSETSIVRSGRHVVVGYNSSAGEPLVQIGNGIFFTKLQFSGFSTSHDGGRTFTSGFIPPPAGSVATFGDPALATDRKGNVYYSHLAGDAALNTVIAVSKSTDSGTTFSPSVIAFTDNGADKNWMAVGPDPKVRSRDNVYVTWTRFTSTGSQLVLSRSTDGGASFTNSIVFAPAGDALFSSFIQFSNPVVDASNGRLYIPFLHFTSTLDADAIRVLVSDDAGQTFRFLSFNQAGAPDPTGYFTVTPGEVTDCGRNNGGVRNVLHQGNDLGGGRFGLARYRFATRLVTQPAAAVSRGNLFIAFQSSTSPVSGDPSAGSEINLLYSPDGGATWAPTFPIAASTPAEPQHVHPAIALSRHSESVNVAYYVQQADSKLRTDVAGLEVDDGRLLLKTARHLSSVSFDLTPSNNPFPLANNSKFTTNYDRSIRACYNLGEYMSITAGRGDDEEGGIIAAWGDNRRSWTSPPTSPAAGVHAQADVFSSPGSGGD